MFPNVIILALSSYISNIVSINAAGAVLCFLPGWQDIKGVQQKLEEKTRFSSGNHMIVPCKNK